MPINTDFLRMPQYGDKAIPLEDVRQDYLS
jgi:hypothetical protein